MREDRPGEDHAVGPVVHRDHHQIHPPDSLVKHRARIPVGSGRPIGVHIRHDEVGADAVVEVGRTGIVDLPVVPEEEQLRIPPRVTPNARVIPHSLDGVFEECRLRRKQGFSIEFPLGDRTEGTAGFGEPLKEGRGVRKHVIRLILPSKLIGPVQTQCLKSGRSLGSHRLEGLEKGRTRLNKALRIAAQHREGPALLDPQNRGVTQLGPRGQLSVDRLHSPSARAHGLGVFRTHGRGRKQSQRRQPMIIQGPIPGIRRAGIQGEPHRRQVALVREPIAERHAIRPGHVGGQLRHDLVVSENSEGHI